MERVFEGLNELQRDFSRGRVNSRHVDDVINTLGRVLLDTRLSQRDRDNLSDDVGGLQELRARRWATHGTFGKTV